MVQIDWTPILWVAGGIFTFFFVVITGLISWIAFMFREQKNIWTEDRTALVNRTDKHEEWIIQSRKEVHDLAEKQTELITQNRTSIEFLKELVLKK